MFSCACPLSGLPGFPAFGKPPFPSSLRSVCRPQKADNARFKGSVFRIYLYYNIFSHITKEQTLAKCSNIFADGPKGLNLEVSLYIIEEVPANRPHRRRICGAVYGTAPAASAARRSTFDIRSTSRQTTDYPGCQAADRGHMPRRPAFWPKGGEGMPCRKFKKSRCLTYGFEPYQTAGDQPAQEDA